VVALLGFLHLGGHISCLDAADANDSGVLDVTDPIVLLDFLFRQGAPPPDPYPEEGPDPTDDPLGC
jgi:hypothetical protein